jgi:hypothetical protein
MRRDVGEFSVVRRTLFCRRCKMSAVISQVGQAQVIIDVINAVWMRSLILTLNRLVLNRGRFYNELSEGLGLVICMFSLHVILL